MEKINLIPEMWIKARAAASAEALIPLAKAYGIELDTQAAQRFFAELHPNTTEELSAADLDKVAGGLLLDPEVTSGC